MGATQRQPAIDHLPAPLASTGLDPADPDDAACLAVLRASQTVDSRALVEEDIGEVVGRIADHLRSLGPSEVATVAAFCDAWLGSYEA